jgi:hypothetical protein
MKKQAGDWLDSFEELTESSGTPTRIRRWAAIACVAGVLERKVWVHTAGADLFPNLYVFLVTPPGIGKSRVLNTAYRFWIDMEDHRTAPASVSKASLIDELESAHRAIIRPGCVPPVEEFHSLKVLASELGVFLPEFANDFMNTLTDLYDCYPFGERKRTRNLNINLPKPQVNLLAGTTPDYLTNLLPPGAWDQGFLSRTILVHASERKLSSLFAQRKQDMALRNAMKKDLDWMGSQYGEITFTPEAAEMIDEWYLNGQSPQPDHPKLTNYNTRRPAHILKLCQVAAILKMDEMVIDVPEVQRAMDWLMDAETAIPEIFKAMASGGDAKVMQECWHFLFRYKNERKTGAPMPLVVKFLAQQVPTYKVPQIIALMEQANMIRQVASKGEMLVEPKERGYP